MKTIIAWGIAWLITIIAASIFLTSCGNDDTYSRLSGDAGVPADGGADTQRHSG